MIKRISLLTVLFGLTFLQAEHKKVDANQVNTKIDHAVQWGYEGKGSPEHWSELDKRFFMCKKGTNQSPINLSGFTEAELPPIKFNYHLVSTEILDNGHTEQINVEHNSSITIDNIIFELKQFHFHTPSENNINGKSFPLEAHFVHASKDGHLAVIAVMFKKGKANEALTELWKNIPTHTGEHHAIHAKHLNALLPVDRDYYRFNGSLTTPPCTEGVRWLVMKENVTVSKNQIATFAKIMHLHNNRPIQKTHARMIVK